MKPIHFSYRSIMIGCCLLIVFLFLSTGLPNQAPLYALTAATPATLDHTFFLPLIERNGSQSPDSSPVPDTATPTLTTGAATETHTPLPSTTPTSTPSSTQTPTPTPSMTPTRVDTLTVTPSVTPTPSPTSTNTPTLTPIPTTVTPLPTTSATPTGINNATVTPSATPIPNATATMTHTPTQTATPTHTPTNTTPSPNGPQPCNQIARNLILQLAELPIGFSLFEGGPESLGEEVVDLGAVDNYVVRYINYLQLLTGTSGLVNVVIVFQTEAGAEGYLQLLEEATSQDPNAQVMILPTYGDRSIAYKTTQMDTGMEFTRYTIYLRQNNIAATIDTVALSSVAVAADAQHFAQTTAGKICTN